jgi:two-component system nitrogen regulation response regulator GlnG
VLITGESGTGKERIARAIHDRSERKGKPFLVINCGALPEALMESELFGHEKGAFTGAISARQGRFEMAEGGTLFLDEIGDMPQDTQTRLLRVLADGEFYRVGGHSPIKVDVRIIAATHQNLEDRVRDGSFREDLFHRLNVISVHVPTLAERRTDIPLLARHFLDRAAAELGEEPKILRPETMEYMSALPWPGNVRQLENTCRWLTVMASGREIHPSDLPPELKTEVETETSNGVRWEKALESWAEQAASEQSDKPLLDITTPKYEEVMIRVALRQTGGRRQDAAKLLGWGRNTLTRKISELHLTDL